MPRQHLMQLDARRVRTTAPPAAAEVAGRTRRLARLHAALRAGAPVAALSPRPSAPK